MSIRIVAIVCLLTLIALAQKPDTKSQLPGCKANLQKIAQALDVFSQVEGGESGHFPDSLKQLEPGYIDSVGKCPSGFAYRYTNDFMSKGNEQAFQGYYVLECRRHRRLGFAKSHGFVDPTTLHIPKWVHEQRRKQK